MIELRSQVNFRISQDCNISLAITHILTNPAEADDAGYDDSRIVTAYMKGYERAGDEAE